MHPLLISQGQRPRTGDVISCQTCGVEFYRQPAYIQQNRRFCSQKCGYRGLEKTPVFKLCSQCGTEMRLRPSQVSRMYCTKACEGIGRIKRATGRMVNGKPARVNSFGYVLIWDPEHPNKTQKGWQFEHRLVVEQSLGRYLTSAEQVDHINQNKADNRIENLQVLDASSHSIKTNAENLGALKGLRDRLAEYERRFGPLT